MRKTRLLVCTLMGLLLCLAVHAQEPVVSFPQKQMTLAEALAVVEQQSGLSIAYNENLLDLGKVVSTPSGNPLPRFCAFCWRMPELKRALAERLSSSLKN